LKQDVSILVNKFIIFLEEVFKIIYHTGVGRWCAVASG
jgi:hypothetical protein